MDYKISTIEKQKDTRGDLVVFLRKKELPRERVGFGQIYFITFKSKGTIRGNHYHRRWREWFGVVHGKIRAELEDVVTKQRVSLTLSADERTYTRLEIGPNIAHAFCCLTPSASLLNYADDEWRSSDRFHYRLMEDAPRT